MIYTISNATLHDVCPKFDFANPPVDPIEFAHSLTKTMLSQKGIGLAANQIGFTHRVFAIAANPVLVCYNPIIVDESSSASYLEEACLSFPGLALKVKRPDKIKVRYADPTGTVTTNVFSGLTARIFQHELDHLNGITYDTRATRYHREQAKKKLKR